MDDSNWWGFGKMFNLGKLPMDFQVQGFHNAVKPDTSGDWQLPVQLKLIFPTGKKKKKWLLFN